MSAPLPEALRARFRRLIEEGLSGRAAALRLKLSPATGARWGLAIRRTGQASAAPQGRPRGKGKLDPHRSFLIELIDQDGDMTMPELAGALADATAFRRTRMRLAGSCASLASRIKKVTSVKVV
jgi:transposase